MRRFLSTFFISIILMTVSLTAYSDNTVSYVDDGMVQVLYSDSLFEPIGVAGTESSSDHIVKIGKHTFHQGIYNDSGCVSCHSSNDTSNVYKLNNDGLATAYANYQYHRRY